jgi:hypothetical protein
MKARRERKAERQRKWDAGEDLDEDDWTKSCFWKTLFPAMVARELKKRADAAAERRRIKEELIKQEEEEKVRNTTVRRSC